jgi:hypothetical protein
MTFDFLVESYATERVKVVSAWSEFTDPDLKVRPRSGDPGGRSVHEHMVHQCVSEDGWFRNMPGVDVGTPPLPQQETRLCGSLEGMDPDASDRTHIASPGPADCDAQDAGT